MRFVGTLEKFGVVIRIILFQRFVLLSFGGRLPLLVNSHTVRAQALYFVSVGPFTHLRAEVVRLGSLLFSWSTDHLQQVSGFEVVYIVGKNTLRPALIGRDCELIEFLEMVLLNISQSQVFFHEDVISGRKAVM